MRNSLILGFVALFSVNVLAADSAPVSSATITTQDNSSPSLVRRIIPEASLLTSTFTGPGFQGPNFNDVSSKGGTSVGLLADIGRGDVQFETGLIYRQLGAIVTPNLSSQSNGNIQGRATDITLRYLSVPFTAVAYDAVSAKQAVYLKAGVLASSLVSREESVNNSLNVIPGTNNFTDGMQNFELDAMAALGGKMKISNSTSFIAEISYLRGITSLYTALPVYNSSLSLTAGMALEL